MNNLFWLGIDLGGTKILAEVYDSGWKRIASRKRKTKAEEGQECGLERLLKTAAEALQQAGVATGQLGGVGIGCPGPLDLEKGVLITAPNLGWKNVRLRELLQKTFGAPAVVANDVDTGVFGEWVAGAGKGARSLLGVFPGTGIGGGLIHEGKVFRGKTGSCLEIGHMTAVPGGARCGCGRLGCLETVSSRLAIASAASMAVLRGQAPWLKTNVGSNPADYRSGVLAEAIAEGDSVVKTLVEDACDHLGRVLGDTVNLLAPDVVVLGGGLIEAMPGIMLPRVEAAMRPRVMKAFEGSYKLLAATLGDHAVSLGAAALARQHVEPGVAP